MPSPKPYGLGDFLNIGAKLLLHFSVRYDIIDLVFTIGDNYDLVIYFDIRPIPYRDPAFFRRLRHFSAHRAKKRQARREL
jgi:hypothetical protein